MVSKGTDDQRTNPEEERPSPNGAGWRIHKNHRIEARVPREIRAIVLSELFWWENEAFEGVARVGNQRA